MLVVAGGTPKVAAEVCAELSDASVGPLPGGTGPADFGAIPAACGRADVLARLRGTLLVASSMPDYYGSIAAGAMLRLERPLTPESWFSLALDAAEYRYVNRGGLAATAWSIGPPTLAFYRSILTTTGTATAAFVRALLPLDSARTGGVETGLDVGASFRARFGARTAMDGGLVLTTPVDIVGGQVHPRLRPGGLAEAWYAPRPTAAVGVGLTFQAELGPDLALLTAGPRVSGRFALRHGLWLATLVELPVTGSDRTDLVASLFVGYGS